VTHLYSPLYYFYQKSQLLLIFCILFDKINGVRGHGGEKMANIKSAKKRIKVNETKRANNVPVKSVMKTTVKKALTNPTAETFNEANKKIDKALKSGIITKNKAARQKSRIAKKLNNNN
jgi:small subunit ribosomal protein S20